MQLKTIFNRVTNYKPFVVQSVELKEDDKSQATIEVTLRGARKWLADLLGVRPAAQWIRPSAEAAPL